MCWCSERPQSVDQPRVKHYKTVTCIHRTTFGGRRILCRLWIWMLSMSKTRECGLSGQELRGQLPGWNTAPRTENMSSEWTCAARGSELRWHTFSASRREGVRAQLCVHSALFVAATMLHRMPENPSLISRRVDSQAGPWGCQACQGEQRAAEAGAQRAGPVQRGWDPSTRTGCSLSDGFCLEPAPRQTLQRQLSFPPSLFFECYQPVTLESKAWHLCSLPWPFVLEWSVKTSRIPVLKGSQNTATPQKPTQWWAIPHSSWADIPPSLVQNDLSAPGISANVNTSTSHFPYSPNKYIYCFLMGASHF